MLILHDFINQIRHESCGLLVKIFLTPQHHQIFLYSTPYPTSRFSHCLMINLINKIISNLHSGLAFNIFGNIPHPTPPQDFLMVSWWIFLIQSYKIYIFLEHLKIFVESCGLLVKLFLTLHHHKIFSWSHGESYY